MNNTEYKIAWITVIVGTVVTACGIGLVGVSARFSYAGYETVWSTVPMAGAVGAIVSVLAYAVFFAATNAAKRKAYMVGLVSLLFGFALTAADMYGNFQALNADVSTEQAEYEQQSAAYSVAETATRDATAGLAELKEVGDLIDAATEKSDIEKIQLKLIRFGLYEGRVDGQRGGLTEKAMLAFGKYALEQGKTLQDVIDTNAATLSKGKPQPLNNSKGNTAIWVAIGVSLANVLCSIIGAALLSSAMVAKPREDEVDEEDLNDLEDAAAQFLNGLGAKVVKAHFRTAA